MRKGESTTVDKNAEKSQSTGVNLALLIGCIVLLVIVTFLIAIHLGSPNDGGAASFFSYSKADLGTLGDLLGGALNPILSFATICLLVWSIQIQLRELADTREELKKTNKHHEQNIIEQNKKFRTEQIINRLDFLENRYYEVYKIRIASPGKWRISNTIQDNTLTIEDCLELPDFLAGLKVPMFIKVVKGIIGLTDLINQFEDTRYYLEKSEIPTEFYTHRLLHIAKTSQQTLKRIKDVADKKNISPEDNTKVELGVTVYMDLCSILRGEPQTQTKPD
jgi:uncharacterized membrane protein YciS (DUF1049 family)